MKKENLKTIGLIILRLIVLGGFSYVANLSIYQDGYTKGFENGGNYIVNYQTSNYKIFIKNESGSLLELNYNQLGNYWENLYLSTRD